MILDFIKQFPKEMGGEVQYYYRRGNKFFFRSMDKSKIVYILVSKRLINDTKRSLKFKNTYSCNNKNIES